MATHSFCSFNKLNRAQARLHVPCCAFHCSHKGHQDITAAPPPTPWPSPPPSRKEAKPNPDHAPASPNQTKRLQFTRHYCCWRQKPEALCIVCSCNQHWLIQFLLRKDQIEPTAAWRQPRRFYPWTQRNVNPSFDWSGCTWHVLLLFPLQLQP